MTGADLWLRIIDPAAEPVVVGLVEEGVIGRDFRCDVVVHDSEVSRMHARVAPDDRGWVIVDLATTNGTLVNGARIVGPAMLSVGDVIRVGRVSCEVVEPS